MLVATIKLRADLFVCCGLGGKNGFGTAIPADRRLHRAQRIGPELRMRSGENFVTT
jgi:hypothetical protein